MLYSEKKRAFIGGDYNINLLKFDSHHQTNDFVNCLFSHSFMPVIIINRPTRITESSATLIDNIITNCHLSNMISCIPYAHVSDHLPVILTIDLKVKHMKQSFIIHDNTSKHRFIECPENRLVRCHL